MLFKIDGFGSLSTIVVYNDAVCYVTRFWPPDWLLLHTSSIPWCLGAYSFQLVSHKCSQWQRKPCNNIFQYDTHHPPCQLINKGSESWLKSRFTELTAHFMERTSDQVKLFLGDSWFSHVECSIRLTAL